MIHSVLGLRSGKLVIISSSTNFNLLVGFVFISARDGFFFHEYGPFGLHLAALVPVLEIFLSHLLETVYHIEDKQACIGLSGELLF